jgi:hypothetical protein
MAPRVANRRPPLLAGGLLSGAGLIDVVTSYPNTQADPFMVMTQSAIYRVDITGWIWVHMAVGVATVAAGLLVAANRRWTALVGVACAGLSVAFDILTFPYQPARAVLVLGLNIGAIRLLIRHRRARVTG